MRILYFYPENPLLKNQGNNARALSLLNYFKNRNITVDFVGVAEDKFTEESIKEIEKSGLIHKGYLLKGFKRSKHQLKYFFCFSLPNKIFKKIKEFDRTRFGQKENFESILKQNEYDYIIISYVYWANLVKNRSLCKNAKVLIDTHDFLTSQFQGAKGFKLGKWFEKEISILNSFDKILAISIEEQFVFSQFIDKEIKIVAHTLSDKSNFKLVPTHDIVYVASDNDHNIKSAKWFFEKVYPLLPKNLTIRVVGRISNHIDDYPNVEKIVFVEDLDSVYTTSKIAICPMLSGTGVKIKVVEAMSFGLPIVCNERGVDGLTNKSHNGCLVTNSEVEFAQNVEQLLYDNDLYNKISHEAKTYFDEHHNQEFVYKELDHFFKL